MLLSSGGELETYTHIDQSALRWEMGKIKKLMTDFDERLGKRKKQLDESVQLHKLIESVGLSGLEANDVVVVCT